ncbi:hypothetical protein KUH03_16940 [Sphingobacterium sp. E70]|uniref:hypothetical protein n=1 Tax=Sphingobacterium sp. E70 TaxID=2853439 RepID=UPI00211C7603|nr:hypothetical protein [Sphingobacterium sp. E70]ULT28127.1 hypothetical protein KUH03_16940 [Sphingobacterium sp. E70]
MINKFMALGAGLLLSVNLMAQSAQDFKQTYADLSVFEDAFALKLKKVLRKSRSTRLVTPHCAG